MPKDYPKPEFEAHYRDVVRPLAMICAKDYSIMVAAEDRGSATQEEEEIIKKYKDPLSCWYVGLMIKDLDTAMIHGQGLNMINGLNQVYGTLKEGSTYWGAVWENDFSS
ncbi:MAG: hypothetical protein IT215_01140 [Chitinophagaceae bacterium]|nr:hypothetical protein [Chitinophagaceae bacterium]